MTTAHTPTRHSVYNELDDVLAQRDALVAALERAIPVLTRSVAESKWGDTDTYKSPSQVALDEARAALAAAKGEA